MSVIASHWSTTHRGCALPDQVAHLLAEHAGVGEEQRRLPAEDERRRDARRPRVGPATLCHPVAAATRPSTSPCGHQLRWKNSRIDSTMAITMPCEHAEEHDAGGGHERQRQRADAPHAARRGRATAKSASESAAAITTAASAVCGRSARSELKNSSSSATHAGADQPGELALRARLLGDRRARAAGRHGEALEQAGGDVRRADADHLLVRVRPRRRGGRRSWSRWRWCRSARPA